MGVVRDRCRTAQLANIVPLSTTEDFSYFTLLKPATPTSPATSLFGISCTHQLDASTLIHRPPDVTRSTVQKAVVVITDTPVEFGVLRERLGVVTEAWFQQRDFTDVEILRRFGESLVGERTKERERRAKARAGESGPGSGGALDQGDGYLGMSLRELVREFRWQTLVLFKCCLLQPKVSSAVCESMAMRPTLTFRGRCSSSAPGARGCA